MWQQWVNLIAGAWIVISSYFDWTLTQMITNFTISGIIVAGLALWGALEHRAMMSGQHKQRHA